MVSVNQPIVSPIPMLANWLNWPVLIIQPIIGATLKSMEVII